MRGTLVASGLTVSCSTVCCAIGIYAIADRGLTVEVANYGAISMILLGALIWTVPPMIWSVLAEDNEDSVDES